LKKKICVFLMLTLLVLSGCKQKDSENSKQKLENELEYISQKIFNLADKLNNVVSENYEISSKEIEVKEESEGSETSSNSGSKEEGKEGKKAETIELEGKSLLDNNSKEDVDWKYMKQEIETINNIWSTISIDLKNEKVADNVIQSFNAVLNQTILSIKDENKKESLNNIMQMYSFIPIFSREISLENTKKIMEDIKLELIKSYVSASNEDWNSVAMYVTSAQTYFYKISDNNENQNNNFKIDKINSLFQTLQNSIELQDFQVFLLQYKTLIENINML